MADADVSPLARSIRFGEEIQRRRALAGMNQETLARLAGLPRTALSRVESPDPSRRADHQHMRYALRALVDETADDYPALERLIWDATQPGWWRRWPGMGAEQQLVAAVECGARLIREYQTALVPGLAQTRAYARYRAAPAAAAEVDIDAVVDGRLRRQQQIAEPDAADQGTKYQVFLEPQVLSRPAAPPKVMAEQLEHLVTLAERSNISVRVLPVEADLEDGWAPINPYAIYSYPDPADPTLVLVDEVGHTRPPIAKPGAVDMYVQLHQRLAGAALSDVDSVALIKDAAGRWSSR